MIVNPYADKEADKKDNTELIEMNDVTNADCLIVAVGHSEFKMVAPENIGELHYDGVDERKGLFDVKGLYMLKTLMLLE